MKAEQHQCPECGKAMVEEPLAPGVWLCPDYKTPLNDAPPFRYKCRGLEVTEQASADFHREAMKIIAERN